MKKFKFSDGSIITASTVEEAKAKHKVIGKLSQEEWEKGVSLTKEEKSLAKKYGFNQLDKIDRLYDNELGSKWVPNSHTTVYVHLIKEFNGKPSYYYYVDHTPFVNKGYVSDSFFDVIHHKKSIKYTSLEDCLKDATNCFKRLEKLVSYIVKSIQDLNARAKNFKA